MKQTKIILVFGSGGVGKTTTCAAMGYSLAKSGKKTLVITIDPSKRLKELYDLKNLDSGNAEICSFEELNGLLWGYCLDSKHVFNESLSEMSLTEEQKNKILKSETFEYISRIVSGFHEFAGIDKIAKFLEDSYDYIIVDTPPSANAIDFLEAHKRFKKIFESKILQAFFVSHQPLQIGLNAVFKVLKIVFSPSFLNKLGEVLQYSESVLKNMLTRSKKLNSIWMDSSRCKAYIVFSPKNSQPKKIQKLRLEIEKFNISVHTLVCNRLSEEIHYDSEKLNLIESELKNIQKTVLKKQKIFLDEIENINKKDSRILCIPESDDFKKLWLNHPIW